MLSLTSDCCRKSNSARISRKKPLWFYRSCCRNINPEVNQVFIVISFVEGRPQVNWSFIYFWTIDRCWGWWSPRIQKWKYWLGMRRFLGPPLSIPISQFASYQLNQTITVRRSIMDNYLKAMSCPQVSSDLMSKKLRLLLIIELGWYYRWAPISASFSHFCLISFCLLPIESLFYALFFDCDVANFLPRLHVGICIYASLCSLGLGHILTENWHVSSRQNSIVYRARSYLEYI